MKKQLFIAVLLLGVLAFGQAYNPQSFNLTSDYGYFETRASAAGDNTWRTAMLPTYSSSNQTSQLILNFQGDFNKGVRVDGEKLHIMNKLGIGSLAENPVDLFQIEKSFSFVGTPSGHDVILFRKTSTGDLDLSKYSAEIRFDPANGKLSLGTSSTITSNPITALTLDRNGSIGIGTANPDEKLTVKGKIHAEEIKVDLAVPADYVFQKYFTGTSELKPEYSMLTLSEVESFVKENNHLPSIPSAKEIQENGLHLGEMNNLLLQKVEELTLYIIEQNKRIEALEGKVAKNK